jgi:hypothetical protein
VELKYVFFENYVDQCHPNHPDCVTGVTCDNCSDGFNPTLDVACNLVTFSQNPIMTGTGKSNPAAPSFSVRPNPTAGEVEVYAFGNPSGPVYPIELYTIAGVYTGSFNWDGKTANLDLSQYPRGMYLIRVKTQSGMEVKKLILQ